MLTNRFTKWFTLKFSHDTEIFRKCLEVSTIKFKLQLYDIIYLANEYK